MTGTFIMLKNMIAIFLIIFGLKAQKIAIVGSGIAGSSAAYQLQKVFPSARITVFEKTSRVGGRVKNLKFEG